jgi:hypothetical protein
MNPIDEDRINELCQELRPLLDGELAAGNTIVETWKGWPRTESLYIMLTAPFSVRLDALPQGVRLIHIDDPHYWKSEFVCERTHHVLACGFGR